MCVDMSVDVCIDVCMDMSVDVCIDMCMDMSVDVYRCVWGVDGMGYPAVRIVA